MNALTKKVSVLILLSLTSIGCSNRAPIEPQQSLATPENGTPNYDLISANLVNTLGMLDSINEITTTFQMLKPETDFGKAVYKTIESEGYGVQLVSGDLGSDFLRYKAELSQTENGILESYSLSVGDINVERQYAVIDGNTVPTSPVRVRSNETIYDEVDDAIFTALNDPSVSSIVQVKTNVSQPQVKRLDQTPKQRAFGFLPPTDSNVHDLQESNFAELFGSYYDIEQQTLFFPNDSLRLGNENKKKLAALAKRIDPETDIISVIGCSHGKSRIANGNQVLAEGRTQRVAESLMIAGLDPELILDEACWASEYWDEMAPRRGVMVTHKRLIEG